MVPGKCWQKKRHWRLKDLVILAICVSTKSLELPSCRVGKNLMPAIPWSGNSTKGCAQFQACGPAFRCKEPSVIRKRRSKTLQPFGESRNFASRSLTSKIILQVISRSGWTLRLEPAAFHWAGSRIILARMITLLSQGPSGATISPPEIVKLWCYWEETTDFGRAEGWMMDREIVVVVFAFDFAITVCHFVIFVINL